MTFVSTRDGMLFHGDYGPPDPTFIISGSASGLHAWAVSPKLLKEARNLGEAEAIQRHLLQGQTVAWCDQGYAWVEQDAIGWFYIAALLFVVRHICSSGSARRPHSRD
jgi:hypothetical protein